MKYENSWSHRGDALKSFFNLTVNDDKPNMSVVYVVGSYHYDKKYIYYTDGSTKKFNSFNPGIGLEVSLSDNSYYTFGTYINSYYRMALGGAYGIETKGGPFDGLFGIGAEMGGILGYNNVEWDKPISYMVPYAGLTFRIGQPDELNMKLTVTPTIKVKDKVYAAGSVGAMLRKPF